MKELIDAIVFRIEDTEDQLKKAFKLIKNYGDKYYEGLSIDYEILDKKTPHHFHDRGLEIFE